MLPHDHNDTFINPNKYKSRLIIWIEKFVLIKIVSNLYPNFRYELLQKKTYSGFAFDGLSSLKYKLIDLSLKKLFIWILVDVMEDNIDD